MVYQCPVSRHQFCQSDSCEESASGLESLGADSTYERNSSRASGASHPMHIIFTHISGAQTKEFQPPSLDTSESSGKSCDSPLCRVTVQWWVRCTPVISSLKYIYIYTYIQRYLVHLQISPQIPSDQHIRTKYNQISITGQLWLRHPEAWYTKEMIRRNCLVPRKRYPFI